MATVNCLPKFFTLSRSSTEERNWYGFGTTWGENFQIWVNYRFNITWEGATFRVFLFLSLSACWYIIVKAARSWDKQMKRLKWSWILIRTFMETQSGSVCEIPVSPASSSSSARLHHHHLHRVQGRWSTPLSRGAHIHWSESSISEPNLLESLRALLWL